MKKHILFGISLIVLTGCNTTTIDDVVCTQEYSPVCTQVRTICETEPCPSIDKEYENACLAEKDGATIVFEGTCEDMAEAKKQAIADKVIVVSPEANSTISSPLMLEGEAPGNRFFEGSAPVRLLDSMGVIIAESYITAQGDRMTTKQVAFAGTLEYQLQGFLASKNGTLVFQANNASGEEQFDIEVSIPVVFQ